MVLHKPSLALVISCKVCVWPSSRAYFTAAKKRPGQAFSGKDPGSTAQLRSSLQTRRAPRPATWRLGPHWGSTPVAALLVFYGQVPTSPRLPTRTRPRLHGHFIKLRTHMQPHSTHPPIHPTHQPIPPPRPGARLHGFPAWTTARTSPNSRLAPAFEAIPQPSNGATIPLKPVKIMRRCRPGQYQHRTVPHRIASHRDIVDSHSRRATADCASVLSLTLTPTQTYSRKLQLNH
jgi:hypothetical protein